MNKKCIAPVEKFRDYIFKPGATHGKERIFESLGYNRNHSEELAALYAQQAASKYAAGEFSPGLLDEFGQRVSIEIDLSGVGEQAGKTSHLLSGWLVLADGSLKLTTPFGGFTAKRKE